MAYAALHNHSYYSVLDSTLAPERIVEAACLSGMTAVGLCDRDTLAGAVLFYKAARAAGIHPVMGAEVTLTGGTPLVLFIENAQGYRNLSRLLTARVKRASEAEAAKGGAIAVASTWQKAEQHRTGVTLDDVAEYAGGLICLCGPRSAAGEAVRRNQSPEPHIARLHSIFGRNLALELSPHNDEDLRLARIFSGLARRLRIPVVTTCDTHYLAPEERPRYDALSSMRTLTLLNQQHPDKLPAGRHHWHTAEEMTRYFGALPQAMENSARLAERCRFDFDLGDIRFPKFPCDNPVAMLRQKTQEGLQHRYGAQPKQKVLDRLEREMSVIEEVGYAEYFLIFHDLVEWARTRGIESLARGSAAGSLVCYLLGISNVCPFRFGLCFERFLNRERMQFAKLADIDLDLPWDRREEVVDYVFDRYGREHVAMIGAVHTFQGRSAVADLAKVYGIPEREARRFTEYLPWHRGNAENAVRETPECRHLPYNEEPYKTVLAMAGAFDGLPRHFSMHPCGLVISSDPIADRMPLFESAKGILTTHYAMDDVEELGLLKLDLLAQAGLTVMRETLDNVRDNGKPVPDLNAIDWTDEPTWDVIATGNARGVFHIESPAMTNLLQMTNCRDIDCLTAVESIIRPGAANEGRKRAYARRHQGLEPVEYAHPSLEPLLADTYGILAYEEHILLVANGFAGMPWGSADLLRRALVKNRDKEKIERLGEEFRAHALRTGRTPEEAQRVWELLREFAGYMFNKAHSAAYAVEAFSGAWLKTRYPVEFLSAVLTSRRGFYAPLFYVLEALRQGARFLTPDVHASEAERFLVEGDSVRLPLNQIKGLSDEMATRIARAKPFLDLGDFYRRIKPTRADWLSLLKTGAFDSFHEPRGRIFWRLQRLESAAGARHFAPESLVETDLPESLEADVAARARWEHELLGYPVSLHPLDYFAPRCDWNRYISAADLAANQQHLYGKEVTVCGLIVADRHHPTANGTMKFLSLADWTGFVEVSLFADTYRNYGHLTAQPVVAVRATVDPFDNRKGFALNASRVLRHAVTVREKAISSVRPE